jgi:hypothetical protein
VIAMAIVEVAILYNNEVLIEKQYYSTAEMLDKNIRNSLLKALSQFADVSFKDQLQSFNVSSYSILMITIDLQGPLLASAASPDHQSEQVVMYCIVDKNSDEKTIKRAMEDVLAQFLERYSIFDIRNHRNKDFKKFIKRIDSVLGDLVLKSEDRFKSLF